MSNYMMNVAKEWKLQLVNISFEYIVIVTLIFVD